MKLLCYIVTLIFPSQTGEFVADNRLAFTTMHDVTVQ